MKKSLIALIISIVFLCICLVAVIFSKNEIDSTPMDIFYVKDNFNINLTDSIESDSIVLTGTADYLGEDKILNNTEIKLGVSCFYTYEDNGEEFTDILDDDIILKYENDSYKGTIIFPIVQNTIKDYSCSYSIVDVNGSYVK